MRKRRVFGYWGLKDIQWGTCFESRVVQEDEKESQGQDHRQPVEHGKGTNLYEQSMERHGRV